MKQNSFDIDNSLIIFTDGSALGNPGPGGYGAVILFPMMDECIELGGNKLMTTNNEMELTAVISALSYSSDNTKTLHIFTDSSYVINGITKWVHGWERNNWQTTTKQDVSHRPLWESLVKLVRIRETSNPVHWHHVAGHAGIPGNERCDVIATSYSSGKPVSLYRGKLSVYTDQVVPNILHTEPDETLLAKKKSKKKTSSEKPFAYVSLVDNIFRSHDTWAECEQQVKGVKGKVKFKKVFSLEELEMVKKEWKQ